ELIFFHDGIKAEVKIEVAARKNSENTKNTMGNSGPNSWDYVESSTEISAKKTDTKEWIWAKALSEANSLCRTTLISG
ncbi:hypothetical protein EAY31_27895, partial [Vibrio anguillarum]|nr:hypothetical protein [Vibrio anguillarum]